MSDVAERKLCLFCETWASGGIEAFLHGVLTHADLTGLRVDLVAARLEESVFTKPLEALGVRFLELSGSARKLPENRRMFRRLLEREGYDAAHFNVFQAVSLGYADLAARAGVPVRIAHSHNTALRKSLTRPLKLALHRVARARRAAAPTLRLACSAQAGRFLFGSRDFQMVPNGVDTGRFRFDPQARDRTRRELGCGDRLVIGHVGRLCPQKNQSFLLDVLSAAKRTRPESLLLLVGAGEDRPALEEKARRLGLEDSVIFYGATPHVERLLWAMDVFVLPSLFEGLSVAAVEAQAAGLGALYADTLAPETAVTDRAEPLALSLGAEAWAKALLALARRTGADRDRGAQAVRDAGFEVRDVARRLEGLWRQEAARP